MKKVFDIELIITAVCLLFAVVISSYHLSHDGFLGLSDKSWSLVWAVGENGIALSMSIFLAILMQGIVRKIFKFVFVPYFVVKLIYHISCYSGIVFLSEQGWSRLWSIILVVILVITIFICRTLLKRK